ncbi:MAG: proline--tRNA ligase [Spirochaetota bacterium]
MQFSKFFIPTLKEAPKDASIQSHILMIRAGMIKKVSSGIYSFLPLGYRVIKKVEDIIREEMNRIGGIEFSLPVLVPGELWKQSKRWFSMGPELYRLRDRNNQDLVLTPTHEEVFTYLLRENLRSYRDMPLTVYHIGPKFRDEIRPRFGVMRAKVFIMKDAYSFHRCIVPESLDRTYSDMGTAYRRIFKRCGLETIPVAADSGTMGGTLSEEFMVPSHVGEEEIVRCNTCSYVANREKASCMDGGINYTDSGTMSVVETPNVKTISELNAFLKMDPKYFIKTLVYRVYDSGLSVKGEAEDSSSKFIVALIRGDLEVNETKLKNYLGAVEIQKGDFEEVMDELGIPLGFAGPVGLKGIRIVGDHSVKGMKGCVTGANRENYHFKNVNEGRDFSIDEYTDLRLVKEGDRCPVCNGELSIFKGIELGHIFKLGDKYTRAFDITYIEENGSLQYPNMGCYGIGVERTMAAVIEQNHDENGIIWPVSVAPFHVYIVPVKHTGRMKEVSQRIESQLEGMGVEVLLDDRDERPGVKFMDADLIGLPLRITVGDRGLKSGNVELVTRKTGKREEIPLQDIASVVNKRLEEEFEKLNP